MSLVYEIPARLSRLGVHLRSKVKYLSVLYISEGLICNHFNKGLKASIPTPCTLSEKRPLSSRISYVPILTIF